MKEFDKFLDGIVNNIIWGWPLIILILVMSLYFGFKTKFCYLRYFFKSSKYMFEKNEDKTKVSPFQAISLIIANQAGTGNIIGVAAAIFLGGPGAILWMWITALVGSSLSFAENTLAQMYKSEINQEYRGGPSYYILKGLKSPKMAIIVSFILLLCLGLLMPTIQSATISNALEQNLSIPKIITALLIGFNLIIIIIGENKKIVTSASLIVPFMTILFFGSTLTVLFFNLDKVNDVFYLIFNNAFNQNAVFGAIIGEALSHGVRRGLFTHEAGLGSTPNTAASGNVRHPVHQGLTSSFCVFLDILMCTLTAFVIIATNSYNVVTSSGDFLHVGLNGVNYEQFAQHALSSVFPNTGSLLVSISILLFGFMAIVGAFYNGQTNLYFIFKDEKKRKRTMKIYKVTFIFTMAICCLYETTTAWKLTDIAVGVAALINLIVLFLLRNDVFTCLKDYEENIKDDKNRKYINEKLECWKK